MNTTNQAKQAGYGLVLAMVLIAVAGFFMVQMLQHHIAQRDSSDAEIRRVAGELKIVQEQSLAFLYDNERWPNSITELPTASGLTTVQTFELEIMPPSSDALSFQLTAASEDQARMLTRYMVNGVSDGLVVTSTLPPPYEVVSYDDYVQRYASTTVPERNTLEQDIFANNQSVYNVGDYTGEYVQSETLTGDALSTNEARVSDELTIGSARVTSTGSQMNVSSSQSNFSTIRASMAQLSAGGATGPTSANRFQGANFTASGAGANENQIYAELTGLQAALDECMYEGTRPCMPQQPVIDNVSCPNCSDSDTRENFSATVSARISGCRQGCTFTWNRGSASGSCASGNVLPGLTQNVTCNISRSGVEPGSVFNTNVSIAAVNANRSDLSASRSVPVRWENTSSAETDLDNIVFETMFYGGPNNYNSGSGVIPMINGLTRSEWGTLCSGCSISYTAIDPLGSEYVGNEHYHWELIDNLSCVVGNPCIPNGDGFWLTVDTMDRPDYPSQSRRVGSKMIRIIVSQGNDNIYADIPLSAEYEPVCQIDDWQSC